MGAERFTGKRIFEATTVATIVALTGCAGNGAEAEPAPVVQPSDINVETDLNSPSASSETSMDASSSSAYESPSVGNGVETTVSVPFDQPITEDGPFGPEYAPLSSYEELGIEVLVPTMSVEEMDALSWEEFAKLPLADRIAFFMEKTGYDPYTFFGYTENVSPALAINAISVSGHHAYNDTDSPETAAKLAIARKYITTTADGSPTDATLSNATAWSDAVRNKSSMSSLDGDFAYTGTVSFREPTTNAAGKTIYTSVLEYNAVVDYGKTIVDQSTMRVAEVPVRLFNGKTVVVISPMQSE